MESMMPELDLFALPANNLSVERSCFSTYLPVSSLDGMGPIEFFIAGSPDYYTDLKETLLQVKVKVCTTRSDLDKEEVGPVNNFLHSLFSAVELQIQDKTITDSANYPFKSYIESLLNNGRDVKESQFSTQLYIKESDTSTSKLSEDDGFKKRKARISKSQTVEMLGYLHLDLFKTERYLINNVSLRLKLHKSQPEFCLIDVSGSTEYKIVFESAVLFVKRVKISPEIQLAHMRVMNNGVSAKYLFTATGVKYFSVAAGLTDISRDNQFIGHLPTKIVVGFTSTSAFNGLIKENPFQFKTYDLCHLALVNDSETYPSKPFTPNFKLKQYTREFQSLFSALNMQHRNKGNFLTYDEFVTGNSLYAIDLSADILHSSHALEMTKQGNLRLEARFSVPLPENVTCIIYYEYDNMLQIDKNRHVLLETII